MNKSIGVLCLSVSFFVRIFREQELQKKGSNIRVRVVVSHTGGIFAV